MGDPKRGLYNKFIVQREDRRDDIGEKHYGCEYFVLDLDHDKYAVPALRAYAEHCEAEYPALAADLHAKADEIAARLLPSAGTSKR